MCVYNKTHILHHIFWFITIRAPPDLSVITHRAPYYLTVVPPACPSDAICVAGTIFIITEELGRGTSQLDEVLSSGPKASRRESEGFYWYPLSVAGLFSYFIII